MVDTRWVPLRAAWHEALYGPHGFYRNNRPADHFRTSVHSSRAFARAMVELGQRHGLAAVCDVGAGGGELLTQIHGLAPSWQLTAVEIHVRPPDLPPAIRWQQALPSGQRSLIIANELLDNVACDVVERDADGFVRLVEVGAATGEERLGSPASSEQLSWLSSWWPLTKVGQRADIGLAREALWSGVCAANPGSLCLAIDYGHCADARPIRGSLTSYQAGRQTAVSFDGHHDITAHVAMDSLAASIGGKLRRQRDALHDLGVGGTRPPVGRASIDPKGYLHALADATQAASLTEANGLGDFYWLLSPPARRPASPLPRMEKHR